MQNTRTYRTTAKVVGALFLAGVFVYGFGNGLIQAIIGGPDHLSAVSAGSLQIGIGALLMLMAGFGDATHGVLMFPLLKAHRERVAYGYLAFRIVDGVFLSLGVLLLLLQVPLGGEYLNAAVADTHVLQALSAVTVQASVYAYQISMITLGIAGLLLCSTLFRAKLLPRPVAIWGLAGYAIILTGYVSEFLGSGLGLASSIPGGLFELFIGFWLIAKGFGSPIPEQTVSSAAPATARTVGGVTA